MDRRLRHAVLLSIVSVLLGSCCAGLGAQTAPSEPADPERAHAMELYRTGRCLEGMPLLEKLAADHPKDVALREGWAWCVFQFATTQQDPAERKKLRARAHAIAVEASKLGDNSQLLQVLLEVPADGSETLFSDRKEVEDAMRKAEADFARGDMDKARDGYLTVLALDPKNYDAPPVHGGRLFQTEFLRGCWGVVRACHPG